MNKREIIACDEKHFMKVFNGRYPVVIDHGHGVRVYGKDGKEYIDFLAGIGVNALGYGHPALVKGLKEQIEKLLHSSNLYYIEPQAYLEKLLTDLSFADRVFFSNSGAEANEGAIKLARKYFKARGEDRYEIITALKSFHGRTMATLAATGQEKYREPFKPLPPGFVTVPLNDLDSLEKVVNNKTAAIMLEPIQGEGGVYPADKDYLSGVRELCDREGILLIFDEIQCGLGRTGTLFAYEEYGVVPDIMTLAKALGGGVPIGAFLAKEEVASAFSPGDHGSTFGGNHLATKAGYITVKTLVEEGILEHVKEIGKYFKGKLLDLMEKFNVIKEVRGKGLMLAVEFNRDVDAKKLTWKLFEKGFLVNAVGEHTLRFLPPLIITEKEIDLLIDSIRKILLDSPG